MHKDLIRRVDELKDILGEASTDYLNENIEKFPQLNQVLSIIISAYISALITLLMNIKEDENEMIGEVIEPIIQYIKTFMAGMPDLKLAHEHFGSVEDIHYA